MTPEYPIIKKPEAEVVNVISAAEPEPTSPPNPLVFLHSLLRGRYPLAIGLALLGAVIGAPLGYFLVRPEYQSTGAIEVRATLPFILYETEQNRAIPNFGPFLLTQVEVLRSSRVVGLAMQDPEWRAVGRGLSPEQVEEFNKRLEIQSPQNSQLIYVRFSDSDAKVAATAVKAVIKAYEQVFVDLEIGAGTPLMNALENLKRQQAADLKAITDRMQALAGEYDSVSIQQVYDIKLKMWLEVEVEHKRAQVRASLWESAATTTPNDLTQADATPSIDQLLEPLIQNDPWLKDLERERVANDRELRRLRLEFGASHPKVAEIQNKLELVGEDIARRTEELRQLVAAGLEKQGTADGSGLLKPNSTEGMTVSPRAAVDIWKRTSAAYKAELDDIAEKKRQIDALRYEETTARQILDATKTRMLQLNVEGSKGSGRLSVISYGEVPLSPEKDRRIALTAVGAMGLSGLGLASVLAMGFLDRRMRHVESTQQTLRGNDRLLGVMPIMPEEAIDPAKADDAAFCVHRIRAMLQIRQRITGHRTIGVTSPAPGDGKTTLVISLGISLAATGCRTLLVDCDFDGGGLSSRLRRLTGASKASGSNGSTSEVRSGLRDALYGAPLDHVVIATGYANLSLLPLGMQPGESTGQLSPTTLHLLFSRLAADYDTILIDTGPILGSVEASIVAAEVDSMIMVVSRDGDRSDAAAAIEKLTEAGAQIEGIVFNRALEKDVARSVYRSAASRRSVRRSVPEVNGNEIALAHDQVSAQNKDENGSAAR